MSEEVPRGIDGPAVTAWLTDHVPGVEPPFRFGLIAGGHSNLTYRVTDATGRDLVLRRPPMGHVLATAHDMAREHRIISGVSRTEVPVPEAIALCEDESVNGAPFYVMSHVDGLVPSDAEAVAEVRDEHRRELSAHVADVLADLHAVEPGDVGLGDLGKREDYIARQVRRWTRQWEQSKTREIPAMEQTQRVLTDRMPAQVGAAIVHGDYRLGNMIVGDGRIRAVLDWELCTLGDPMADIGYLLNTWAEPGDPALAGPTPPTLAGGFATRDEILARYAERSGRDVSDVGYYRAFSYWRLAAITEGVYRRYVEGVMADVDDDELARMRQRPLDLAAAAADAL